jgi:hypothetical protein
MVTTQIAVVIVSSLIITRSLVQYMSVARKRGKSEVLRMGKITEKVIKETYGVDSITINGCILIPFYQVIDKLNRLAKIEQIVKKELSPLSLDEMSNAEIQIREIFEKE